MSEGFERTLDALEQERERVEAAFRTLLAQLEQRVAKLREAAAAAGREAADTARPPIELPERAGVPGALGPPPAVPWPAGKGRVRRLLNRFVGWLARDYLHVLDRRADAVAELLARQGEAQQAVQERLEQQAQAVRDTAERARDAVPWGVGEAVRESLDRAVEVADLLAGIVTRLHELLNAKDAEVLQRAAHGPLRKMELVFEEFGRQQEALLAQLVGRRRELDRLLRGVASGEGEADE